MSEQHRDEYHNSTASDEIDLYELASALWIGRWKLALSVCTITVASLGLYLLMPQSFNASLQLVPVQSSAFIKYTDLNDLLEQNKLGSFKIDAPSIFNKIVAEFSDYKEVATTLEQNSFVQEQLLNSNNKQKTLLEIAKSFRINPPATPKDEWTASYKWHSAEEGANIFSASIDLVLKNVQKSIEKDIQQLPESIEARKRREQAKLESKLEGIAESARATTEKMVQFLSEQAEIAKELGIEKNRLNSDQLSSAEGSNLSLSINSSEAPYYLRGYKAINKEKSLLVARPEKKRLIMTPGYIDIQKSLMELERDKTADQLRGSLEVIRTDNPQNWLLYNFALAEIKTQKKLTVYLLLGVFLGGMIGLMWIFVSSAILKRNAQASSVDSTSDQSRNLNKLSNSSTLT